MNNLFVGNLSYATTREDLEAAFSQFGNVHNVNIITDRDTGQPRGFAFVEMGSQPEAQAAISQLDGAQLNGRAISVREARPKPARSFEGGGGGVRSGFGARRGSENRRSPRW
jgi:RNA recognition motif-containing protein